MSEAIGWIREVVLDCADPWALARFWAGLLGGTPVEWYQGWVTLEPPPHGQRLSFQGSASPRVDDASRVHFDVLVEDLGAAHDRVTSADAVMIGEHVSPLALGRASGQPYGAAGGPSYGQGGAQPFDPAAGSPYGQGGAQPFDPTGGPSYGQGGAQPSAPAGVPSYGQGGQWGAQPYGQDATGFPQVSWTDRQVSGAGPLGGFTPAQPAQSPAGRGEVASAIVLAAQDAAPRPGYAAPGSAVDLTLEVRRADGSVYTTRAPRSACPLRKAGPRWPRPVRGSR
ncbi:MAG: VOC family protein [Streptosporangiaceae bacterium]